MTDKLRAYLYLHFCVLIWGFTAILGKLISLQAVPLVWWRVFLCCITLVFIIPPRLYRSVSLKTFLQMFGIGVLVGLHWMCFYGAIKWSNASVAVATMATATFFSALAEPAILRRKINALELLLGLFILPGIALIVGSLDYTMQLGFALGILGALLAAVFSSFNKKLIDQSMPPALVMSFTELAGGLLVCSLLLPLVFHQDPETVFWPKGLDWLWLLILAWGCTLLPYYLTLLALRRLSAFTANLAINLEPVYGIMLAAWIFQEHKDLEPKFYVGVLIILLAVFGHPLLKKRTEK